MVETSLPVPDPLERLAQSANKTGFVWVEATPGLITGDIRHFAELNGVEPALIGGFWYGQRGPDDSVGQRASPKELVVYNLHGKSSISPLSFLLNRLIYKVVDSS
jgi:hypothetical protein